MNTAGQFIIGGLAAYGTYRILDSILDSGKEGSNAVRQAYKVILLILPANQEF